MASSIMAMTMAIVVSSVSVVVVVSSMAVRIVTMPVTVSVVRRRDGHLEIMPSQVGEHTVLDVASQVTLLREGIPVLL